MAITSEFFTYFKEKLEYFTFHELEKESAKVTGLLESIKPQFGTPFVFFIWFIKGGFDVYYKEYWLNFPFIHREGKDFKRKRDKWTYYVEDFSSPSDDQDNYFSFKMVDDLNDLLNEEFKKVTKIYETRWKRNPNKEEFYRILQGDLKFIESRLKINNETNFPNKAIEKISKKFFDKFISTFKKEINFITDNYFSSPDFTKGLESIRNNLSKKTRKKSDEFRINSSEATGLYNLSLTKEGPNFSLIDTDESNGDATAFQKILSTYDYEHDSKFIFNCQTKYVAFIFKWLQNVKKFKSSFPSLERMNCFYTKGGRPIKAGYLNTALTEFTVKYIKFVKRNEKKIDNIMPNSSEEEILNYLSSQLSKIFSQSN